MNLRHEQILCVQNETLVFKAGILLVVTDVSLKRKFVFYNTLNYYYTNILT